MTSSLEIKKRKIVLRVTITEGNSCRKASDMHRRVLVSKLNCLVSDLIGVKFSILSSQKPESQMLADNIIIAAGVFTASVLCSDFLSCWFSRKQRLSSNKIKLTFTHTSS